MKEKMNRKQIIDFCSFIDDQSYKMAKLFDDQPALNVPLEYIHMYNKLAREFEIGINSIIDKIVDDCMFTAKRCEYICESPLREALSGIVDEEVLSDTRLRNFDYILEDE